VLHGFDFPSMDVHPGVGEIRQAAGMIEVQVRHDDMPDGFGCKAQAGDLAYGGLLRVVVNAEV
jgi:hypothetical protein